MHSSRIDPQVAIVVGGRSGPEYPPTDGENAADRRRSHDEEKWWPVAKENHQDDDNENESAEEDDTTRVQARPCIKRNGRDLHERLTSRVTGRRGAKRRGNPQAQLAGGPVDAR